MNTINKTASISCTPYGSYDENIEKCIDFCLEQAVQNKKSHNIYLSIVKHLMKLMNKWNDIVWQWTYPTNPCNTDCTSSKQNVQLYAEAKEL